jgi:hypothetical protein
MGAVFMSNSGKFQTHPASTLHVPHNRLGSDLPFFDKKIYLCFGSDRLRFMRLNKNSARAQIANAQNIFVPEATPIHPKGLMRFDA